MKHSQRENKVIQKLSDKGGNIRAQHIRSLAVGVLAAGLTDQPVERIIYQGRGDKSHRRAEQNKPRPAENAVIGAVIGRRGRNDADQKEDQAGQQIDAYGVDRNEVGGLWAKMLSDNIHAHKGEPRNKNTAVESNPVEFEQGLIGQQIHTNDADGKKRDHRGRYGTQQNFEFGNDFFHPFTRFSLLFLLYHHILFSSIVLMGQEKTPRGVSFNVNRR